MINKDADLMRMIEILNRKIRELETRVKTLENS